MYLYQVPIKIPFPDSATPQCLPCSKDERDQRFSEGG